MPELKEFSDSDLGLKLKVLTTNWFNDLDKSQYFIGSIFQSKFQYKISSNSGINEYQIL